MKTMNKWMMLCGVMVGLLGVGCGGPLEQEPSSGDSQEATEAPGEVHALVCSYGWYTCPSDGEIFEYESLACEFATMSKPKAQTLCESHCPVTCKDSGWKTY